MAEVVSNHLSMVCDRFDLEVEDIIEILDGAFDMPMGCILEDFFSARFGEDGERNVIDDYLARRGWREKVPARRYLTALRDSVISLYEVVAVDPGRSMTIRDLLRGGEPVTVKEKKATRNIVRWDRIATRVVTVNGQAVLTGGLLPYPPAAVEHLRKAVEDGLRELGRELRREARSDGGQDDPGDDLLTELLLETGARLVTGFWLIHWLGRALGPGPTLINADGDEILFTESRFPLAGATADVAAALDASHVFERSAPRDLRWNWFADVREAAANGDRETAVTAGGEEQEIEIRDEIGRLVLGGVELDEDALLLTTNSRSRDERGRELLADTLGALVGPPLTSSTTPEELHERGLEDPIPAPALPQDETRQAIQNVFDDHYRRVLDEPMPFFDGKTPRQAVRSKAGRAKAVEWLKQLENTEARRARNAGEPPCDTVWLWRELGLEEPV